jgi:glucose/arabinose dehydrogenase
VIQPEARPLVYLQRVRDVRQGPDGLIDLLTEEEDGAVLKIEPAT